MRLATWRGSRLSDSSPLMSSSRRSSRVELLAAGQQPGGLDGGRGLVGEDRQEPQVVVVEAVEAELGQRDDPDRDVVVAHRDDEHRLVDVVGPGDGRPARVARSRR